MLHCERKTVVINLTTILRESDKSDTKGKSLQPTQTTKDNTVKDK